MDSETKNLLEDFQQSNKFKWQTKEADVIKLIDHAVKKPDLETLKWFISNPPKDDDGIGWGPKTLYKQQCSEVVFPFLKNDVDQSIAECIFETLRKNGTSLYDERFYDSAFEVLHCAGPLAMESACFIVRTCPSPPQLWKRAVEFVCQQKATENAPDIVIGIRNLPSSWSGTNIENAIVIGIKALMELDPTDRVALFSDLLSIDHQYRFFKETLINALGNYGDEQASIALNKRLGGFFKKIEPDEKIRKKIQQAIHDIYIRT